jgi:hypothetical protein
MLIVVRASAQVGWRFSSGSTRAGLIAATPWLSLGAYAMRAVESRPKADGLSAPDEAQKRLF